MSAVERLAILVTADGQGAIREFGKVGEAAERDLGKAETRADRVASRMTSAGAVMMSASAVMVAGLWNAGQAAAAQEQAVGGAEAVFKEHAEGMRTWAEGADQAAGLSTEAALRLSTQMGGALKGLGYDLEAAADQSQKNIQIAADLAATYGGTTAEAVEALGAAYRGEFDPAERFNLFLKQSTVDAKAVEMGLADSTSKVDAYARAQAVTALIMEQSTDAQGQFGRELDSTSGRLAVTSAQLENAKAQMGEGFLPVMAKVGEIAGTAATGIASADEATGGLISEALAWTSVGLGAAGATSFLIGKMIELKDSTIAAKGAQLAMAHPVAAVGVAAVLGGIAVAGMAERIGSMVYEGRYAVGTVEELSASLVQLGRTGQSSAGIDGVVEAMRVTGDTVSDTGKKISAVVGLVPVIGSVGSALVSWGDAKGNVDAADEAVSRFEESIKSIAANDGAVAAANAVDQVELALINGGMSAADAAEKVADARGSIQSAVPPTKSLADAQADAAQASTDHAGAAKALNDTLKALVDPMFGAVTATNQMADAQQKETDAQLALFYAETNLAAVRKDKPKDALAIAAAERAVADAANGVRDAQIGSAQAAIDYESSLNTLAGQLREDPSLYAQNIAKIDEMERSGRISAGTADYFRVRLSDLATQVGLMPPGKDIKVTADTGPAYEAINAFTRYIQNLPPQMVPVGAAGGGFATHSGQRAAGGPMAPWSVYQLHDTSSPEIAQIGNRSYIFTGAEGGRVTNLDRASASAAGMGGLGAGLPHLTVIFQAAVDEEGARRGTSTALREWARSRA